MENLNDDNNYEMESLNLEDFEVEEIEQRLELAALLVTIGNSCGCHVKG